MMQKITTAGHTHSGYFQEDIRM